jgi:phage-related protein
MKVRELVTKLKFVADNVGIKSHEASLLSLKNVMIGVTGIASRLTAAAFGLAVSVSNTGDEIAKTSRFIGVSADSLQTLRYAAGQAGVSTEELDNSLRFFNRNLGQASEDAGAAKERLEQLGISLKDANGNTRNISDMLPELAEKFKGIESQSEKAAIAQDLFGRAGQKMTLLLEQGGPAIEEAQQRLRDFGGVMSGEALDNAEKLNDSLDDVRNVIGGLKNSIGAALMPVVLEVTESFKEWYLANKDVIHQRVEKAVDIITTALKAFWSFVKKVISVVDSVVESLGGWEKLLRVAAQAVGVLIALKLGGWVGNLVRSFKTLTSATKALNLVMSANPMGLIVIGIVALLFLIDTLIEDFNQWKETGDSTLSFLWEGFSALADWFGAKIDQIVAFFEGLWQGIKDGWQSIKDFFSALGDSIMAIWDSVCNFFSSAFDTATELLKSAWETLGSWFSSAMDILLTPISTVVSFIEDLFDIDLAESGRKIIDTLINGILSVANKVKETISGVLQSARNLLPFSDAKEGPFSDLTLSGKRVIETISKGVHSASGELKNTLGDVLSQADNAISEKGKALQPLFNSAAGMLGNEGAFGEIQKAMSDAFTSAAGIFDGVIGKMPGGDILTGLFGKESLSDGANSEAEGIKAALSGALKGVSDGIGANISAMTHLPGLMEPITQSGVPIDNMINQASPMLANGQGMTENNNSQMSNAITVNIDLSGADVERADFVQNDLAPQIRDEIMKIFTSTSRGYALAE